MIKTDKRFYKNFFIVALLITTAVICRYFSLRITELVLPNKLLVFSRTFIYLALFSYWGVSVNRRVINNGVRRMLVFISAVMVFWITAREFKFRFVIDNNILRFLWYSYYIAILIIPLIALLVSMSLAKPETYRLPKWAALFCVVTAVLLFVVLTNDFHQFVFVFPKDAIEWTEKDYSYGAGYYIVVLWCFFMSFISLGEMLKKSRIPKTKKHLWLPIMPFAAAAVYVFLYALRLPFIMHELGDTTIFFCLVFTGYFESCIQCGLIQSNSRYYDLFTSSVKTSAQIADLDYNVSFVSSNAEPIEKEKMKEAKEKTVVLDGKKLLHNMPIDGGFAIWTEDVSDLLELKETLEFRKEELKERNALLQLEYEKEKEHKTIEEQNRLYDLLQSKTQTQLDSIERLMEEYKACETTLQKHSVLSKIVVLGTYIKRRKNFVLTVDSNDYISEKMLESALSESYRALKLSGIQGGFLVNCESELISGKILTTAYDFFETVLEATLDRGHFINTRVSQIGGKIRINILTDCDEKNSVISAFPNMKAEVFDDGCEYILTLEGGEDV